MSLKSLGLYLHIPYCVKKCAYCDFLSFATGGVPQIYVERLLKEIRDNAEKGAGYTVDTVFFGGGTPSLLTAGQMQSLCGRIRECFAVAEDAEWSMECNPGTADYARLSAFRRAGINRLSIGLQSPCDAQLVRLGRIHTWGQFLECFAHARAAGFDNINVDIMSALPGQSVESYREGLHRVAGLVLAPEHISAYSLILEEGTPLYESRPQLPDEDEERQMYEDTKSILAQYGYHRYEISNYAKQGKECRHNLKYWTRKDYLGMGLGASSFYKNTRYKNTESPETYLREQSPLGMEPVQRLSVQEQMEEFMFLGLRLTQGVREEDFRSYFGQGIDEVYGETLKDLEKKRLLIRDGGRVRLTGYGTDISNYVLAYFLLG